jgi:excinuclease UvrABC ATPase subunit
LFAKTNNVSNKLFSRNSEGACSNCKGLGIEKIDLVFMEDEEEPCEVCHGSGFNPEVLIYKYQNKNIAGMIWQILWELFVKVQYVYLLNLKKRVY